MKKEYLEPEIIIKKIDFSDILTSSLDPEGHKREGDDTGAPDDPGNSFFGE